MLLEIGWSKLSAEEIARRLTYSTFSAHGLSKMLDIVYGSSPYAALRDLFPTLQPWQMKHTPQRYWQGVEGRERAREATLWMLRRLGLQDADPEDIAAIVDQRTFDQTGLRGMLEIVYRDSPFAALVELYPYLQPWQMVGGASVAYWKGSSGREHARAATRWMITQIGLAEAEPGEVARHVTSETFKVHGLTGMLSRVYRDSPYSALKDVYPELKPRQMARVPRNYGLGAKGREYARAATSWIIKQLQLQDADPATVTALIEEGTLDPVDLAVMLGHAYENNSDAALVDAYSGLPHLRSAKSPLSKKLIETQPKVR